MPSTEEEVWRYSRVSELDLADWAQAEPPIGGGRPRGVEAILDAVDGRAATVIVLNGYVIHADVAPKWAERGVFAGRLIDAPDAADAPNAFGAVSGEGIDVFSRLNDARTVDPVYVRVPAGVTVDQPIVIVDWSRRIGLNGLGRGFGLRQFRGEALVSLFQGLDLRSVGKKSQLLGKKEIAGVTVLDGHDLAFFAQFGHGLQENDFHWSVLPARAPDEVRAGTKEPAQTRRQENTRWSLIP
jgi:hypothetical protein